MTPPEKSRFAWIPLAAALLALVVFSNSLFNGFVWDDNELIVDNPAVHSFSDAARFFSGHFWSQSGQPSARGYYRPLVMLSYAVDYKLWGPNPLGFHLTNMLWHALASALVCMLVMRVVRSKAAALAAGVLFAVHPVHVESVTFISGRTDVIATAFVLMSAYLFFDERSGRAITFRLAVSVVLFALGLLAKEVAAVLPALLLLGDAADVTRRGKRAPVLTHAMYWAVLGLYLLARFGVLGIAPELQGRLTAEQVLLTMPTVVVDYFRLLVIPINLCADYVVRLQRTATPANVTLVVSLLLVCGAVVFLIVKKRVSGFLAAWILVGLLPVMQIIPISVLEAERFLYLPSVGFCGLVGWAFAWESDRAGRMGRRLLAAALVVIVLGFSLRTLARNPVWKDEFTLYRITESCAPDNFRVQYNLGNAYFRAGDVENARRHTEKAFRLRPNLPQTNYNLGVIYAAMGRLDDAETMYRRAIELDPGYASAHSNLATILYSDGRYEEARREWSKALSLDPSLEQAREGLRLLEQGKPH